MSIYDFNVAMHTGDRVPLSEYQGKTLLIVNTASQCGFTPQYEGLERLNKKYLGQGLQVLGFPCNQFAHQDPADDKTIAGFCQKNYGVSFPVFSRIEVNGRQAHPLYKHLKNEARGIFWSKRIKWNFTKFLVNGEGKVVKRYAPMTKPERLMRDIEQALRS